MAPKRKASTEKRANHDETPDLKKKPTIVEENTVVSSSARKAISVEMIAASPITQLAREFWSSPSNVRSCWTLS